MSGKISEFQYEQDIRQLESTSITNVWYETDDEQLVADIDQNNWHSIARAAYLQTIDNRYFRIYWGDELNIYHGFGVMVKQVKLFPDRNNDLISFSHHPAWQPVLHLPVVSVSVHWQRILEHMRSRLIPFCGMGHLRRTDFPQSLEINFGNGQSIWFSALAIRDNENIPMANHLTLFFSKATHDMYNQPLRKW